MSRALKLNIKHKLPNLQIIFICELPWSELIVLFQVAKTGTTSAPTLKMNYLLFNPVQHKPSRNENNWHLPAGRRESNKVLRSTFPRQQLICLLTPAFSHAASVASTDVCETLTFITSTCRSSLSEGVTLTAFSIWLSNCFSSESVSTDTNLSSDSSFCREKTATYRLRQNCLCPILL